MGREAIGTGDVRQVCDVGQRLEIKFVIPCCHDAMMP